jgi:HEAT repeat protein
MKHHHIALVAAGLFLGAALAPAGEVDLDRLAAELASGTPATQRTPEQLVAAYAAVLDPLMPDMGDPVPDKRRDPYGKIERIAFHASRPGAEAERAACSKAIAARLKPNMPALASMWLLRQLDRIGRDEAVAQVAAMLGDNDLNVRGSARRALQKNPSKQAGAALLVALTSAEAPAWRAALVNAIGERCDAANQDCLMKEAGSDNDDVRIAAVIGLSKLGEKSAMPAIEAAMAGGSERARVIATESCLRLAEALVAKGGPDRSAALAAYRKLLAAQGYLRCAAIIGLGRAGGIGELPTIFDALADRDARIQGAGIEALSLIEGDGVRDAIIAKASSAEPRARAAILRALASRGDKSAVPIFMAVAGDTNEAVRTAAIAGLAALGNVDAVGVLLKAAAASGTQQDPARVGLQFLPGAGVDKALVDAMQDNEPAIRVEAIQALSARRAVASAGRLLQAVEDADVSVRVRALKALGALAPAEMMPGLTSVLVKAGDEQVRNEASNTLASIAARIGDADKCSAPVLDALPAAQGQAKLSLLTVLGRICGPKAVGALRAAARDNDEKTRDAAIRALAAWPDTSAAQDLLDIARTAASEAHQVLAVRGYIRVCSINSDRPQAETAKMLIAGLEAARRPEEKKQALGAMREVRDIAALNAVMPCMNDDVLKEEAAFAAVRIGRNIWRDHPQAVKAAMAKVIEVSKNEGLTRDATATLAEAEKKLLETQTPK